MDLFDKARKDMEAEVKKSFKWVVLTAIFGLVLLTFMSWSSEPADALSVGGKVRGACLL
jgi:hypothetical protein